MYSKPTPMDPTLNRRNQIETKSAFMIGANNYLQYTYYRYRHFTKIGTKTINYYLI